MVASAFLPVCIMNDRLFFLFGKEANNDSSPGFSDFGGGVEKTEDIYEAGLREFAEETTGFMGDAPELGKMVQRNGGVYKMKHDEYNIHIFRHEYDPKMVKYYNNNHKFVYDRMNHTQLRRTKIFEKIEIQWMSLKDMKRRRNEFRQFYRVIVDELIEESPKIKEFILSTVRKTQKNKTLKNITNT